MFFPENTIYVFVAPLRANMRGHNYMENDILHNDI